MVALGPEPLLLFLLLGFQAPNGQVVNLWPVGNKVHVALPVARRTVGDDHVFAEHDMTRNFLQAHLPGLESGLLAVARVHAEELARQRVQRAVAAALKLSLAATRVQVLLELEMRQVGRKIDEV